MSGLLSQEERAEALHELTDETRPARARVVTCRAHSISSRPESFGAAVRAGLGWGMYPDSIAAPHLGDGSFARISDVHLDVPLYWQCWKIESPLVGRSTNAVRPAAAGLRPRTSLGPPRVSGQ